MVQANQHLHVINEKVGFFVSFLRYSSQTFKYKYRKGKTMSENYAIGTKCVQSGWKPEKGEPRVLPIYQSTTYKYDTSQQLADLFDLKEAGYFYTRLQN